MIEFEVRRRLRSTFTIFASSAIRRSLCTVWGMILTTVAIGLAGWYEQKLLAVRWGFVGIRHVLWGIRAECRLSSEATRGGMRGSREIFPRVCGSSSRRGPPPALLSLIPVVSAFQPSS
jgi:hypothetical protein